MNIAYNREKYRNEQVYESGPGILEHDAEYWEGLNDQFQALHDKLMSDGHTCAAHSLEDFINDYIAPEIVVANNKLTDFRNGEG